ncbi:glycerate 3-kinase [Klebsiella pasteurii]|uniref:Glycerate 3-kinase n=1 Tax=Klebsiella pasteurii TaxID=2587529 RepID=A0ABD5HE48_9ENTR|nr:MULTISPECIES: glycerate 3-kinase [Klebsiella]MBG2717133.1 glycerate 3-kinase [Klebsiella michiganensis]AYZ16625.1 glycerate 3-kinase [Klebsiella sp. FDAARGOS_511]MBZ7661362.1 glycerate 3-kinase [Klebsiella grimontii]MCW9584150.1 glycerate 3-kinase [Klebsiella pasteurii]MDC0691508.1 glycerate 3-kinase [Klebsiella pasteurii]
MKIIIAPDSFKESVSASRCAQAIKAGFVSIFPQADCVCLPIADGGEGTVEAMVEATEGKMVMLPVMGPMGNFVGAFYGLSGDGQTAFIEMAAASGLMLVPAGERNPLRATSYGTGELIRHALDAGVRHIILGIGGSATVDGGMGMAQALGVRFLDEHDESVGLGGGALQRLAKIDLSGLEPRLHDCRIEVACDVDNPLLGERGAAAVFGPQKGACLEMVAVLERGLQNYAQVLLAATGQDVAAMVGGGAAGGMGAAARVFLNATLKSGIDIVLEAVHLEAALRDADLVITGEGRMDSQTVGGKAPVGVARIAKKHGIPVIGIAGVLGDGVEAVHQHGIDAVFSILPALAPLAEVLERGEHNLYACARNIACAIKLGQNMPG